MEVEEPPFETNQGESDDDVQMFEEDDDQPGDPEDEAQEVPTPGAEGEPKVIKPKKVIKNPQPKLDAIRLMGPRGVGILQSTFKDVKFKGKGYEKEDMKLLMKKLEHWAHRLFPKMPFDDTLKQIEKLGTKKPVQNMVKRIRLDMFQSDEIIDAENQDKENESDQVVEEVDVFDELLSTGPFADRRPEPMPSQHTNLTFHGSQAEKPMDLTAEQKERMERNRQLAMEKRKARFLQQMENETNNRSQNDGTTTINSDTSIDNETTAPVSQITSGDGLKNWDAAPVKDGNLHQSDVEENKNWDAASVKDANSHQSDVEENTNTVSKDKSQSNKNEINFTKENLIDDPGSISTCPKQIGTDDVSLLESTDKQTDVNIVTEDDILGFINTEK